MTPSTLPHRAFAFAAVFAVSLSTPAVSESLKFRAEIPNLGTVVTLEVETLSSRDRSNLDTRAIAGHDYRYSAPSLFEEQGIIRPFETLPPYEFFGYGGAYAEVYLDSIQCRADIDVTVYDHRGAVVGFGDSYDCFEHVTWFVNYDTFYFIEVTSHGPQTTDFHLYADNYLDH